MYGLLCALDVSTACLVFHERVMLKKYFSIYNYIRSIRFVCVTMLSDVLSCIYHLFVAVLSACGVFGKEVGCCKKLFPASTLLSIWCQCVLCSVRVRARARPPARASKMWSSLQPIDRCVKEVLNHTGC